LLTVSDFVEVRYESSRDVGRTTNGFTESAPVVVGVGRGGTGVGRLFATVARDHRITGASGIADRVVAGIGNGSGLRR
jgi:hypothetical protein